METKNIFLLLALLCIVIISMPAIYSKFSGQHSLSDAGEDCIKCHSDIQQELQSSIYHENLNCQDCHGISGGGDATTHANVVNPRCLYCHSNIENSLNNDAHNSFIIGSINSPMKKGENEACISCHTTKNLDITFTYSDTYKIISARDNSGWQIKGSKDMDSTIQYNAKYDKSSGQHYFQSLDSIKCEKCHQDMKDQLSSSTHKNLLCTYCHSTDNGAHLSKKALCTDCHVYNDGNKDAHLPFVFDSGNEKNMACTSCHSTYNNKIEFKRPQYIEWDVESNITIISNVSVETWTVTNVVTGPDKTVNVNKNLDGKIHNVNLDVDCILCHQDIKEAVINRGHSNEIWNNGHTYGSDVTSEYCKTCHLDEAGTHSTIKISCVECHSADSGMHDIEKSIQNQELSIQSYLCMSCKNTGNPAPEANSSMHFKYYTEPEVTIYINGEQRYP